MDNDVQKNIWLLKIRDRSSAIILFIGISFIILGLMNLKFNIPKEYITSISLAAFFFVLSDMLTISLRRTKLNLYSFTLLLGVLSFTLLPVLLLLFPEIFSILINSSESLSVISLGLVLIIINIKMWDTNKEFNKLILKSTKETLDFIDKFNDFPKDSIELASEIHEVNKKLLEENKSLKEEIEKEKVKK